MQVRLGSVMGKRDVGYKLDTYIHTYIGNHYRKKEFQGENILRIEP
jgi:hypothetical protein